MMCSVSLHRIFSFHDAYSYDVEGIDEIDTKNTHSRCDLASYNDCTRCDEESEHDCPTISDEASSLGINPSHEECCWYNYCQEREEKARIFLDERISICNRELECKSSHNNKTHESKASGQSRNSIREVDRVKYQDIPTNRDNEWNIIDEIGIRKNSESKKMFIQPNSITKYPRYIGNFNAGDTDNNPDSYL